MPCLTRAAAAALCPFSPTLRMCISARSRLRHPQDFVLPDFTACTGTVVVLPQRHLNMAVGAPKCVRFPVSFINVRRFVLMSIDVEVGVNVEV